MKKLSNKPHNKLRRLERKIKKIEDLYLEMFPVERELDKNGKPISDEMQLHVYEVDEFRDKMEAILWNS